MKRADVSTGTGKIVISHFQNTAQNDITLGPFKSQSSITTQASAGVVIQLTDRKLEGSP